MEEEYNENEDTAREYTAEEIFSLLDRDGNGSIDKSELTKGLQALGCNPTEAEIEALMQDADDKGTPDGRIEMSEFVELIETHRKSRQDEIEALVNAFRLFDKNGDGLISKDELRQALTTLGLAKMSDDEVDELFADADTDDSGFVDFGELVRVIMA